LVEDVGKLELVLLPRHVADVRGCDDVVEGKERVVAAGDRLLLKHVHGGEARPARPQRADERSGCD
jgi:hypothetical protein